MRILVIEDEHKIANSIKKGLEQEAYAVDLAYDGESGYDFAAGEEYDLIILDRMLPGMDGIEISRKLRKNAIHTPIIMLTARGQVRDRVEGLDSGADDYLIKPFAFDELLARIRTVMRRPKNQLGNTLKINNLSLDTVSYDVKREKKSILLTQKEFALLEYLMRHPNQTVSKEQIIAHVWDYDADILPNTVEAFIGYLRNKIDKPFPEFPPLIKTVRGFGYKISEEQ